MQNNWNSHILLVGMQNGATTLDDKLTNTNTNPNLIHSKRILGIPGSCTIVLCWLEDFFVFFWYWGLNSGLCAS
jgi:hypothetical protein